MYLIIKIIIIKIIRAWSWKKINCSIIGELALGKLSEDQIDIH